MEKKCKNCKQFYNGRGANFCSHSCVTTYSHKYPTKAVSEGYKKMSKTLTGRKLPTSQVEKQRKGILLFYANNPDAAKKKGEKYSGENSKVWKGDEISYATLHTWLRLTYGKAEKCENLECTNNSDTYDYAKLRDKKYERKRENYIWLCRSCHTSYDNFSIDIRL